ncbi:hypothetical protein [Ferdinandcohnia sp. Marseille-Q9671]
MKINITLDKITIYTMSGNSSFTVGESRQKELSYTDQSQGTNSSIGDSSNNYSKMTNYQEVEKKKRKTNKQSKIEQEKEEETPALTGIYP